MVVCKFWQQGTCRFGGKLECLREAVVTLELPLLTSLVDRCKFEHTTNRNRDNPFQTSNQYAALQSSSQGQSYANNRERERDSKPATLPYNITKDSVIADLSTERPQWILSAYGPGVKAPAQLFGGPQREQSFEEMRLHHYIGMAQGNPAAAVQEAQNLVQAAETQIQNALQDVDGAIRYVLNSENEHPNRLDNCNEGNGQQAATINPFGVGAASTSSTSNPFGQTLQQVTHTSPFGQPSALGQRPSPFGTATQPTPAAFGQPSTIGANPNPFGAPQPAASGFGQASALGARPSPFGVPQGGMVNGIGGSGFGIHSAAPNPFGAPSQSANPFGQPASVATSSPFGTQDPAPSANPFGTPPQPNQPAPFGAPSPATANPFAAPTLAVAAPNPFGNPPQAVAYNPFGAPQQSATSNPFGTSNQATTANPFGSATQPTASNPFGAHSQPAAVNPFGQAAGAANGAPNPFGKPSAQANPFAAQPARPNGQAGGVTAANSPYPPESETQHPSLESYATVRQDGVITMFKGKPVEYRDGVPVAWNRDRTWEKIWFPEGPPSYNRDTAVDDSKYDETTKQAYLHERETGTFERGFMPLLPPKREWCTWDF